MTAKLNKKRIIGKRLVNGEPLMDVIADGNEELIFKYRDIEANVSAYHQAKSRAKPDCIAFLPSKWGIPLPLPPPTEKKRHYWFWSAGSNFGKTSFLVHLDDMYRCSWYNKLEIY